MGESKIYRLFWWKEAKHKRVHIASFYLCKIQGQASLRWPLSRGQTAKKGALQVREHSRVSSSAGIGCKSQNTANNT